ncbi:MAG: hypothetical protein OXU61_09630 [Gammaproteobacteria bacterium]|nr:hypothetical protein [Gammaproteobacteria bacterium]
MAPTLPYWVFVGEGFAAGKFRDRSRTRRSPQRQLSRRGFRGLEPIECGCYEHLGSIRPVLWRRSAA